MGKALSKFSNGKWEKCGQTNLFADGYAEHPEKCEWFANHERGFQALTASGATQSFHFDRPPPDSDKFDSLHSSHYPITRFTLAIFAPV